MKSSTEEDLMKYNDSISNQEIFNEICHFVRGRMDFESFMMQGENEYGAGYVDEMRKYSRVLATGKLIFPYKTKRPEDDKVSQGAWDARNEYIKELEKYGFELFLPRE